MKSLPGSIRNNDDNDDDDDNHNYLNINHS